MKFNWTATIIVLLIVLINVAAKFGFLDDSSFFLDEAYSVYYAQQDWAGMSVIFEREANPPTYFVILHYWIKIFGISEMATRLLSLLAYSLSSGVVFLIARNWLPTLSSLLLAIGCSFSESLFFLGCETRVHSFTVLAAGLSILALIQVHQKPKLKSILIHGITLVLLFYLHYASSILIAIQLLAVGGSLVHKRLFRLLAVYMAPLIAIIPLLVGMTDAKVSSTAGWMVSPSISSVIPLLQTFSNGNQYLVWVAILSPIIGLIISKNGLHRFVHLMPLLFVFLSYGVSQQIPLFAERYLAAFVLLSTISIGLFASQIKWKLASPILLSIWALAMISTFQPRTDKGDNWRGVAEYVDSFQTKPDVLVSPVFEYRSYLYYADREEFKFGKDAHKRCFKKRTYFADQIDNEFFNYVQPEQLLYVSKNHGLDPSRQIIEKEFTLADEQWFGGVRVQHYVK
ncbi:MAG: mannosyltransferase [Bacteroidia bacterium]